MESSFDDVHNGIKTFLFEVDWQNLTFQAIISAIKKLFQFFFDRHLLLNVFYLALKYLFSPLKIKEDMQGGK